MSCIPEANGLIKAARNQDIAVWGEGTAEDVVRVTSERFEALPRVRVPEPQGVVIRCCRQKAA